MQVGKQRNRVCKLLENAIERSLFLDHNVYDTARGNLVLNSEVWGSQRTDTY